MQTPMPWNRHRTIDWDLHLECSNRYIRSFRMLASCSQAPVDLPCVFQDAHADSLVGCDCLESSRFHCCRNLVWSQMQRISWIGHNNPEIPPIGKSLRRNLAIEPFGCHNSSCIIIITTIVQYQKVYCNTTHLTWNLLGFGQHFTTIFFIIENIIFIWLVW